MNRFQTILTERYGDFARDVRQAAHAIHADVNQTYDGIYPYGVHLDMVADNVARYADDLPVPDEDVAVVWFGAYFHDSIEDARLTYNDVLNVARKFLGDEEKAVMAAEIAYALTNEKGRTRAERADSRYYAGIRATPYAPMVKLADRLANFDFSLRGDNPKNKAMAQVYRQEMPDFLKKLAPESADVDPRMSLPASMVNELVADSLTHPASNE